MTTMPVQIRIDKDTREEATKLFRELGTDLSGAVNMFLKQCVLTESIPFQIGLPPNRERTEDSGFEGYSKKLKESETLEGKKRLAEAEAPKENQRNIDSYFVW